MNEQGIVGIGVQGNYTGIEILMQWSGSEDDSQCKEVALRAQRQILSL